MTKTLSSTLLALAFVCFSLVSLLSANRDWSTRFARLTSQDGRMSELGLRFNMQR